MSNDSLASHPLIKLAMENLQPLLQDATNGLLEVAKQGEVRSDDEANLPEFEFYDDDVFRNAVALVDAIERMEQSQGLLGAGDKASWEGAGLDRHAWIEYHYSYYVVTLVSLADIALILTNAVFRLGNRETECKPNLITHNYWVASTSTKDALEKLAKVIQPYKEGRNLHVHQGKLPAIAKVMESKLLDELKLFSFVERAGKPVVASEILEKGYAIEIRKIAGRMSQERTAIKERIVAVLDALFPVYKQKSEELHEKWREVIEKRVKT